MFNEVSHLLFEKHGYTGVNWTMSFAERCALVTLLEQIRPELSIEIGTLNGGSLGVIAHYSKRVISIDPNPEVKQKLGGKHDNVELKTASSFDLLPEIIEQLNEKRERLDFVLIDGDHTADGVTRDIENVLKYQPHHPLWILMHDSFNPDCREGMKAVDWNAYPHVHWVDFDFVPGFLNSVPGWENEMWCGFALALLKPEKREGALCFDELLGPQYEKLLPLSTHAEKGNG